MSDIDVAPKETYQQKKSKKNLKQCDHQTLGLDGSPDVRYRLSSKGNVAQPVDRKRQRVLSERS